MRDPSWSEIRHFVKFLDLQLQSCEKSIFTDSTLVGDVMSGLKGFVVKFMIRMSRVRQYRLPPQLAICIVLFLNLIHNIGKDFIHLWWEEEWPNINYFTSF